LTEDINQKVINIFSKHKTEKSIEQDENVIKCEDGIYCVCFKTDKNGHPFDAEEILGRAAKYDYIVRVLQYNANNHPYIYNYKVPSSKLLNFLEGFILKKKSGEIIEIDKYAPIELA